MGSGHFANLGDGKAAYFKQTEVIYTPGGDFTPVPPFEQHRFQSSPNCYTVTMPQKLPNKEDGDIFDCIDLYKQPSLDHPLLKNHSIQMEPSSYPSSAIDKFFSINKFQNISIGIERCPKRTVLIRRIRKEELLASQHLANSFSRSLQADSDIKLHWAYVQTNIKWARDYYGAKAAINVYGLREIKSPQSTHSQIWVIGYKKGLEHDFNTIQVGWHDRSTHNWWLTLDGTKVGYWPKELFSWLSEKARGVIWGGVAGGPKNLRSPPMGSGHFANLGDGKAAFFKEAEKEDGDIFDCVDIYKQPSLDHPLLKNHSIQMEPSYYPSSVIDKFSSINKFQNISIGIEGCPEGTVLIRRIHKEELLASQYLTNSFSDVKLHWAYIQTNIKRQRDYYGAKAAINVYGLREIKSPQSTHAQIWVIGFKKGLNQDFNTVQAGWHVHPQLNGDSQSRLFIHWRNHGYKTPGCVNLLCPGFVQVSKSVAIGTTLPVSTFGGPQKEIIVSIFQDRSTRNWWLTLDGTKIGYWPKELFNWLSEKARGVIWGGVASAPKNGQTPPMGSGHFASLGDGKAAYFKQAEKEDGDVFDCVDIYKQPSLDHPLLKNHSIQMEPSYYPSSAIDKLSSINKFQNISIRIEGCPEGTVLIRRIREEELLASQYLTNSFSDVKLHWAYVQTNIKRQRDYYGAKAAINVYGLREIKSPQSTHAQIWVIGFKKGLEQDFNTVQAGWHVDPELHGDSQSRLFIHWRNHGYKTPGCVNLLCPGFVQVSKSVAIGTILPVSTFGGPQKEIILSIFQDRSTHNWWLTLDGTKIGYWPKELFNWLSEKARGVIWGGVASAPKNGRTPPMGSGHFASLGDGKAAYFKQAEIIIIWMRLLIRERPNPNAEAPTL
ncbi:hypothetical protein QJS10_CPB13g00152 [Acorus calamus]|uniref:Neprosin PEP catalytic domain-containing protein n=1 Tax=Acorus calamus TaxID=4465 RepID=A0AAV9DH84_ACOCL|nr:hypothetical protein QJS10_CPB13g00152 [Acorus calamus]